MLPMLPPPFVRQMQSLLGPEWPLLETALQAAPPVSIRLRGKYGVRNAEYGIPHSAFRIPHSALRIPWHPLGFYLPERPVFTLDPAFHAGAYYVQEASSMFIYEALRQVADFSRPLKILDLCAAPGGKSTLLADMVGPDSLLVANEAIRPRTGPLRENLERWGSPQVAITSGEVEDFAAMEGCFDVVVTDAPCSGEGLFRKDPDAIKEWSLPQVEFCASRQKRILAAAEKAVKPGGVLLFSTCTYNAQENDDNVRWLLQNFDLELLALDIQDGWDIVRTDAGGYQFYPHRIKGEGFFLSVFRKKEGAVKKHASAGSFKNLKPLPKNLVPQAAEWLLPGAQVRFFLNPSNEVLFLPEPLEAEHLLLDKFLKTKWFGTTIGEFKGKDFVPHHALALSQWAAPSLPGIDLTREQALLFLKKESFDPPTDAPKGWALARFEGMNLGWVKMLPNRINNYLPQERRIRMAIH